MHKSATFSDLSKADLIQMLIALLRASPLDSDGECVHCGGVEHAFDCAYVKAERVRRNSGHYID